MSWYMNELSAMEETGGGGGESMSWSQVWWHAPVITREDPRKDVASPRPA